MQRQISILLYILYIQLMRSFDSTDHLAPMTRKLLDMISTWHHRHKTTTMVWFRRWSLTRPEKMDRSCKASHRGYMPSFRPLLLLLCLGIRSFRRRCRRRRRCCHFLAEGQGEEEKGVSLLCSRFRPVFPPSSFHNECLHRRKYTKHCLRTVSPFPFFFVHYSYVLFPLLLFPFHPLLPLLSPFPKNDSSTGHTLIDMRANNFF